MYSYKSISTVWYASSFLFFHSPCSSASLPPSSSLLLVPPLPPLPPLSSLHYTHTFIRRIPKGETDRLQQFFSVCNSPYFFLFSTQTAGLVLSLQSPTLSLSLTQTGVGSRRDDNVLCGMRCVCVCVCARACTCVDVAHVVTRTLSVVQLTSEVGTSL